MDLLRLLAGMGGDAVVDVDDFEDWYRANWPRLVGTLTTVTRDREAAADIAAEALSRLWPRWANGTVTDPAAWTYRVAINLARRRHRRSVLERALLLRHRGSDSSPGPEPTGPVWALVATLPDRQRAAIALRYVADLTQPEIAAALGISTGTVASTLHDARRRLAASLDETDDPRRLKNETARRPLRSTTEPFSGSSSCGGNHADNS